MDYQCRTRMCHYYLNPFFHYVQKNTKNNIKIKGFYTTKWNSLNFLWFAIFAFLQYQAQNRWLYLGRTQMLTQLPVFNISPCHFHVIYPEELGHLSGKSFSRRRRIVVFLTDWFHSTSTNKIPSPRSPLSGPGSINPKSVGWFEEGKSHLNPMSS